MASPTPEDREAASRDEIAFCPECGAETPHLVYAGTARDVVRCMACWNVAIRATGRDPAHSP